MLIFSVNPNPDGVLYFLANPNPVIERQLHGTNEWQVLDLEIHNRIQ
jgi:hypothetical protein